MSSLDDDALAKSQSVNAGSNFSLNGDNASTTFLGTRVTIKSVEDESNNSFTITGTDLDGNSISEKIFGGEKGQTVSGLKIFKSITTVSATSATSGNIEVGTAPGYKLSISAEGTIEGDQHGGEKGRGDVGSGYRSKDRSLSDDLTDTSWAR